MFQMWLKHEMMNVLILLLPIVLLLFASIHDLQSREIPDWISVLLILIGITAAGFGWGGVRWWMVITGSLLGLSISAAMFRFAEFGGGDAKLITGIGAILGPVGLLFALFWMAVSGGVLALIAIARGQRDYAYAPAIAAGYLAYLIYPCKFFHGVLP